MVSQQDQILPKLQESSGKVVGLISDTHVPVRAREIPKAVFKVFEDVDYIVHAGDLVELPVIDDLEKLAPVLAVYGNMDGPEVRGGLQKLNSFKVFNWRIGVIHDPGTLFGIRKAREIAKLNGFDVLVYGHTHNSSMKWNGDILFINPGSPTNPLPSFIAKPSVALLRVTKERIVPELIQI
ncbi:MAG: metallophosphoesterase [Candidatus Bathyarchaeia archaeon]